VGAAFSLVVGGAPVGIALSLQLAALGFLAYLSLAAAAAVGLHLGETEPKPKKEDREEEEPGPTRVEMDGDGAVGERVAVRPELHQMRMLFTALGGYTALKSLSLLFLYPAGQAYDITAAVLSKAFSFGFFFVAFGWFLLWQFLRWYAHEKEWVRLQDELVGGDVSRVIAVVILLKPVIFTANLLSGVYAWSTLLTPLALLLQAALIAAASILWFARTATLRRTLTALAIVGAVIVLLTLALAVMERLYG
jgi:hypothetical protein